MREYSLHGLLRVSSEVPLPELARFRTDQLISAPGIQVAIDHRLDRHGDADPNLPVETYGEVFGRLGFAISIKRRGEDLHVTASPLLRFSPHVLYTNVVEPMIRWQLVSQGYALMHGACIAVDGHAFLITARTDTGKTTTMLRLLDKHPGAFISDDMTIVDRSGSVRSYPKPLTISRHTVSAVRTPLLSRRERLALVIQSRLHSRSGRQFGQFLHRAGFPAATMSAALQRMIPPPKYDITRLIPGVEVINKSVLAGMIMIERGELGIRDLDHDAATATLMENSADAYDFPPYTSIEAFLSRRDTDSSLVSVEHGIVEEALRGVPAVTLRCSDMDWYAHIPKVIADWGHPFAVEPEAANVGDLALGQA